jgi:hypothetical protein
MEERQLAFASFSIAADDLDVDFWSKYFGIEPDRPIRKGRRFMTPSGRLSSLPGLFGMWRIESRHTVRSDTLEPHLRYLAESLEFPRADLRDLLQQQNAEMRFFCYWANYTHDRIADIPDDIRAMMESMGGTIEIDEYR